MMKNSNSVFGITITIIVVIWMMVALFVVSFNETIQSTKNYEPQYGDSTEITWKATYYKKIPEPEPKNKYEKEIWDKYQLKWIDHNNIEIIQLDNKTAIYSDCDPDNEYEYDITKCVFKGIKNE